MGTRANIYIKQASKEKFLYRHCDGYPEGLGEDLQNALAKYSAPFNIYELDDYIVDEVYAEFTSGIHGDIEYLYYIEILDDSHCTLKCFDVWDSLSNNCPDDKKFNIKDLSNLPLVFNVSYEH